MNTQMVAQMIVNYKARQVDKVFDYEVPESLKQTVRPGMRAVVPFGNGNKEIEGYIIGISEKQTGRKLKTIRRMIDERCMLDENMIKLIHFMREKYLCSYIDLIHTVVPAGIGVQPVEWILLKQDVEMKSEIKAKIVRLLKENGGGMALNMLASFFEKSITSVLTELCQKGITEKEFRDARAVKDKKIRAVRLRGDIGCIDDLISEKKAPVQYKMVDILSYNEYISIVDLIQFSEGSYSAVNALVKKGLVEIFDLDVLRNPVQNRIYKKDMPPLLTREQNTVFCQIADCIEQEQPQKFLIHGVTGSGKTEVFMRAIEKAIEKGKCAIMLVPEISLTPQMVSRFKSRFGERVAIFHSGLSMGEKYDEWKRMSDGSVDIVVGARSAVFAPFKNIGVIIIDEEHEQTYKSEMTPRYDAKEIACFRAEQYGAVVIQASATPSVETYYKALSGEYKLLEMKNRVNTRPLPAVEIVDMREELDKGNKSIFSKRMTEEIEKNLARGEQSILFLNRRGFSTFVSCRSCGYVAECENCNISLTYHKSNDTLRCHYCGFTKKNVTVCPECGSIYIRYFGGGTQRVEEEIQKLFPNATTIRMDIDTTSGKFGHEQILKQFEHEKTDILIGTQMVTKGLDFPNVTLVGVISADTMLHMDDFRSGERTFNILEQVSGRAGRAEKTGRAIVQTYTPEHEAITKMQMHDYIGFYQNEIMVRQAMWYPPFCDMISVLISGNNERIVPQAARFFVKQLAAVREIGERVQILGPIPASISKIKNKYRWRILIKCINADHLNAVLTYALKTCYNNKNYEKVSIVIDKNPNHVC